MRPCGTMGTLEVPSLYLSLTSFSSFLTSLSEVVVSLLAFLVPVRTCRPPVPNLACTCKGGFQLNFDILLSLRCRYWTLVNIHQCLRACVCVCKRGGGKGRGKGRGEGEGLMVTVYRRFRREESFSAPVYLPIQVPFSLRYPALHSVQFSAPGPEQVDLQARLHAGREKMKLL